MDLPLESRIEAAIATHNQTTRAVVRGDRATAGSVIERLLPNPETRPTILRVLTEIIERAHEFGDRKWSVSLFEQLVRTNVGAIHVNVLLPEVLFLVVDPGKINDTLKAELGPRLVRTHAFQQTGPAMELYLPAHEVGTWWPQLREASFAFVDAAAKRNTSYWASHSPGVLLYLETTLDRSLPRPADRTDSPIDIAKVVARARQDLPGERVSTRESALSEARQLIGNHRQTFPPESLVQLLRLFNTDWEGGKVKRNRFGQAMGGHARNRLVENTEVAKLWIDTLWGCNADSEVAAAIDQLRSDTPLPYAGMSFPAMVLHCKDPTRYFPAQSGMLARGYAKLIGITPVNGASYIRVCEGLRTLVADHKLTPMGLDIVAYFADHPEFVDGAPEPGTQPPEPTNPAAVVRPTYNRDDFLSDTLFEDDELTELEQYLADKPQLVLYGPPGTGKTWVAERLAQLLTGGDSQRIELVQFHPSYGYEDFIEGIRPTPEGTRITYPIVPGVFRDFCDRAAKSAELHVMVIDEINRGNLPRIFGELLFGLERRGSPVRLSQSREQLVIPLNLVVLGTMNTADQSIAVLDMALRRRFHFFRVEPDPERLKTWLQREAPKMVPVAKILRELNAKLSERGVARDRWVGHSHFMRPGLDEERLSLIWRGSILPLMEELFHGQEKVIEAFEYSTFAEPRLTGK